jgi:radical SAM protein with 4Fe4S-binding SPASM domain
MIVSTTDFLNLLSKLTFNRIKNIIAAHWSFKFNKNKTIKHFPISIAVEPTTACNLGCPECPSGLKSFTRPTGNLNPETLQKIIEQTKDRSFYLTFYFQGEPFIHPKFLEMVDYAHNNKFYVATSTNAHFIDQSTAEKTVKSGLDRLIISIDGTTQEIYEQYRKKGDLSKVLEGTQNIIEAKKKLKTKTPVVIFQFLVVKPNEHQIETAKQLAKSLDVDEIRFKTAQIYDYKNGNPLIPENEQYSRYKKQKDGTYRLKNKLQNECWKLWSSCVITWDGKVIPCCFDKDAQYTMGNINEEHFNVIWNNKKYQDFREKLLNGRKYIDICTNCSEGTKVWELN